MTAPSQPPAVPAPDPLGDVIGDGIASAVGSGIDSLMRALWEGCLWLLREAFGLVDALSSFSVDPHSGSVGPVWSVLVWISGAVALGLFFWQLTLAVARGGRGMGRAATGAVGYGVALAVTAGVVGMLVEAADGLTTLLLTQGLHADNFAGAFTSTSLGQGATNGIKAVALGLLGFFGLLPAALGYTMEVIWRQAAILVLVATVPITAAGLLAQSSAAWFWKACRWMVAAVVLKPALALILVIGFSVMAHAAGPAGVLAGVGVLWVSLTAPLALYRMLAFVDPGTDPGGAFRERLGALASRLSGGHTGSTSAGDHDGYAGLGGGRSVGSGGSGGMGAFEAANTVRFDTAAGGASTGSAPAAGTDSDAGVPPPPPTSSPGAAPWDSTDSASAPAPGGQAGAGGSTGAGASDPPAPEGPHSQDAPGPGPRGPAAGGAAGEGGAAAEAAEVAVIL
jgi:hypothetical protein